jgi:PAS domain S-box-containing protein
MNKIIKILHLEDSKNDSELIHSFIENGKLRHEYLLTDNENDYINILRTTNIDIILSDYSLPDYNGNDALKVARVKYPHLPFIFVSGTIGENAAINAMLNGATDYVLKSKLERLVPAIKRAIYEHELVVRHKQAEAALQESERKYKNLVNELNDGYFVTNNQGIITFANLALSKIFGFAGPEELTGHFLTEFNKRGDLTDTLYTFENIITNKIKLDELEMEVLSVDGNSVYVEIKAVPVFEKGKIMGMQGVIHDITGRKIAEINLKEKNEQIEAQNEKYIAINKELAFQNKEKEKHATELRISVEKAEENDKLKTAFLQNMSHEIRTPLNGIIGFSSLLNEEDVSKEEIKEYTSIINQSGKRLIEIVNNILDISKIQTGQLVVDKKPILVNSVFTNLLNFFSPIANDLNIILKFDNQKDNQNTIYSDEGKLNQVLTNLINNAIKFTITGGINFGYVIKECEVEFYVKDTGIGISEVMYDRIFDRFIQAELSHTRGYEGAGLGLAICKGLVEVLGGRIWVVSTLKKGSTFYFTLPYSPITSNSLKGFITKANRLKRARGKILIAEDDKVSSQYLCRLFRNADITILQAENGEQAVEFVRNNSDIDLILMDIRMPVMDGMEATKLIKQINPDLPVIAQSAYAFSEEKDKFLSVGCDEYLAKPIELLKMNELVSRYLK